MIDIRNVEIWVWNDGKFFNFGVNEFSIIFDFFLVGFCFCFKVLGFCKNYVLFREEVKVLLGWCICGFSFCGFW